MIFILVNTCSENIAIIFSNLNLWFPIVIQLKHIKAMPCLSLSKIDFE